MILKPLVNSAVLASFDNVLGAHFSIHTQAPASLKLDAIVSSRHAILTSCSLLEGAYHWPMK